MNGLCQICGEPLDREGALCKKCLKEQNQYKKDTRDWLLAHKICPRCGKRKADYGFKTCGICREKIRNQKKRLTFSNKRDNRVKNGLCFFCDSPVKEGYKVCEKHYEMNVQKARSKKAKEARNKLEKSGILY